jgi:hypothetical protein
MRSGWSTFILAASSSAMSPVPSGELSSTTIRRRLVNGRSNNRSVIFGRLIDSLYVGTTTARLTAAHGSGSRTGALTCIVTSVRSWEF